MDNQNDKVVDNNKAGNNNKQIVKANESTSSLSRVNLFNEKGVAQAEVLLKKIMASEKGGIKSVNEGLAILLRAQDLNLPFSTCIEHIHVINGKTGVDIHIIKSLLLRAGVIWDCTKDYIPQYQYTDGNTIYLETQLPDYCVKCKTAEDALKATNENNIGVYPVKWFKDLGGNIYNEFGVSSKCVVAINKAQAEKFKSEGKFPIIRIPAQPIDYVTEYTFRRWVQTPDGLKEMVVKSHFSYTEAQIAEFFTKDTYKKYARVMIGHRAFTLGARDIAADTLMGVLEETELSMVEDYTLTDADFVDAEEVITQPSEQ